MPMATRCITTSRAATGSFWGGTPSATTCTRPTRLPWHRFPWAAFPGAHGARPFSVSAIAMSRPKSKQKYTIRRVPEVIADSTICEALHNAIPAHEAYDSEPFSWMVFSNKSIDKPFTWQAGGGPIGSIYTCACRSRRCAGGVVLVWQMHRGTQVP